MVLSLKTGILLGGVVEGLRQESVLSIPSSKPGTDDVVIVNKDISNALEAVVNTHNNDTNISVTKGMENAVVHVLQKAENDFKKPLLEKIAAIVRRVEEKDQKVIAAKLKMIKTKDEVIAKDQEEIAAKLKMIETKDEVIVKDQEEIAAKDKTIQGKNQVIESLELQIKAKDLSIKFAKDAAARAKENADAEKKKADAEKKKADAEKKKADLALKESSEAKKDAERIEKTAETKMKEAEVAKKKAEETKSHLQKLLGKTRGVLADEKTLAEELQTRQKAVEGKKQEKANLDAQFAQKDKEAKEVQVKYDLAHAEYASGVNKMNEVRAMLDKTRKDLETEKAKLESDKGILKGQLETQQDDLKKLRKSVEKVTEQCVGERCTLNAKTDERDKLQLTIRRLMEEVSEKTSEITEKDAAIKGAEKKLAQAKIQESALKVSIDQKTRSCSLLAATNQELEAKHKSLLQQKEQLESQTERQGKAVDAEQTKLAEQKRQLESQRQEVKRVEKDKIAAAEALVRHRGEIALKNSELQKLQENLASLKEQENHSKSSIISFQYSIVKKKEDIATSAAELKKVEDEEKKKTAEFELKKKEFEKRETQMKHEKQEMEQQLTGRSEELANLKLQLKRLLEEIENKKSSCGDSDNRLKTLEKELERTNKEIVSAQEEVAKRRKLLDQILDGVFQMTTQFGALQKLTKEGAAEPPKPFQDRKDNSSALQQLTKDGAAEDREGNSDESDAGSVSGASVRSGASTVASHSDIRSNSSTKLEGKKSPWSWGLFSMGSIANGK